MNFFNFTIKKAFKEIKNERYFSRFKYNLILEIKEKRYI